MWKVYLIMFLITSIISYLWVRGIDKMNKKHPEYKGHDFLNYNEDEEENNHNK